MSSQVLKLERRFSQDDFDRFAQLSGDDNPIHVDPEYSSETRFGRTVAHGMLLYSVFRGMLYQMQPGTRQLSQNLMFPAPTFANEAMLFRIEIASPPGGETTATMSCKRVSDEVVTCTGSARLQMESKPS